MNATPVVTVVVPAYNAARWLGETLQCIAAQTFTDWEALIVDDASTDGTPEVVARFARDDARLRHVRLPRNTGGPAEPRNVGVAQARGAWIAFCDADDLWHPRKLELQLAIAQRLGSDLVSSRIEDFSGDPPPWTPDDLAADLPRVTTLTLRRLLGKNVIANSSVLCRRDTLVATGTFDADRSLVAVEDYDMWLRMLSRGASVVKIDRPLVLYRRLPGSLSARKSKLAVRVLGVLRRHFRREGRPWMFPLAAPVLMLSYVGQALYLRLWRGRL